MKGSQEVTSADLAREHGEAGVGQPEDTPTPRNGTQRLVTRLDGMPVVLERRPSGVGTWLWVGEFRTRDDRPMRARAKNAAYGAACVCEVRCGRTIEEVFTALCDTATRLVDKPGRVA